MARVFAINIDLAKNQLINARIHNAPSNAKPANPGLGQIYFDTTCEFAVLLFLYVVEPKKSCPFGQLFSIK